MPKLWEDIIKNIQSGKYNQETLQKLIEYFNSYIKHVTEKGKSIPNTLIHQQFQNDILALGGSKYSTKKQSRKKK